MSGAAAFDEAMCGRIDAQLKALHLPGALAHYRGLAEELALNSHALKLLEHVLAAELASRELHGYQRNLRAARFPVVKELRGFDFTVLLSLPKGPGGGAGHLPLHPGPRERNPGGQPGDGKTHQLIGLGMEAIRLGFRVRFATTATLVNELLPASAELREPSAGPST